MPATNGCCVAPAWMTASRWDLSENHAAVSSEPERALRNKATCKLLSDDQDYLLECHTSNRARLFRMMLYARATALSSIVCLLMISLLAAFPTSSSLATASAQHSCYRGALYV